MVKSQASQMNFYVFILAILFYFFYLSKELSISHIFLVLIYNLIYKKYKMSQAQANKKNIKNALAYLSTTFLNEKRLKKLMFRNSYFLQSLEDAKKKKAFKSVNMVVAFIKAKALLNQDEIRRLFSHFHQSCQQKIRLQQGRMRSNENERIRYIDVVLKFAKYMVQLIGKAIITEEFIQEILSFIFSSNSGDERGRGGRTKRQINKISSSLRYLKDVFPDLVRQTETGIQTDLGRPDQQVEQSTEKLEEFEEVYVELPSEHLGCPEEMMFIEDISIFLSKREEDQIWEF